MLSTKYRGLAGVVAALLYRPRRPRPTRAGYLTAAAIIRDDILCACRGSTGLQYLANRRSVMSHRRRIGRS